MFALVYTGFNQIKIKPNQKIFVNKLASEKDSIIELDKVLLIKDEDNTLIGKPYIKGATIKAKVLEHIKGDKVKSVFFKRRKHHLKWKTSRNLYTQIEILEINKGN